MKRTILKTLCTALVSCSLFAIPANAGTWFPDQGHNCWSYKKDDGSLATGWTYINGSWYYFNDQVDYKTNKNYCYINPDCAWNDSLGAYVNVKAENINGKAYYFDSNGHMLHDCYIIKDIGNSKYWLNSTGTTA